MKKTAREPSKCREWEKVRRDKLNKSFAALSKLLPNHDPALTLSKIDILQKAAAYIEELQQKLKDVLTEDGIERAEREEIKSLHEHTRKLLSRNEQLSNLLKDAGIRIPAGYGTIKCFKETLRWANKITAEQAKEFAEKEAQKENKKETTSVLKRPKLKNALKKSKILAAKHQRNTGKSPIKKKKGSDQKTAFIKLQLSNIMPLPSENNLTKTSSQRCFIIASNQPVDLSPSSKANKSAPTVVTNSSSASTPKMASIVTPPSSSVLPKVNSTLNSLGPGTLILANGNIVPILPQSTAVLPAPTLLTNPTPILLKPPSSNTTLIVMSTKNSNEVTTTTTTSIKSNINSIKTFPRIRPKIGIVTKTTQVNKVPIPALTSCYSSLSCLDNKLNKKAVGADNSKKGTKPNKKRKLIKSSGKLNEKRPKLDIGAPKSESVDVTNASEEFSKTVKNTPSNVSASVDNKSPTNVTEGGPALEKCSVEVKVPLQNVEEGNSSKVMELPQTAPASEKVSENLNSKQKDSEIFNNPSTETESSPRGDLKVSVVTSTSSNSDNSSVMDISVEGKSLKTNDTVLTINSQQPPLGELIENNSRLAVTDKQNENKAFLSTPTHNNDNQLQNKVDKTVLSTASEVASIKTTSNTQSIMQNNDRELQDKNLELGMNLNHSELSNDIFSSLQVPIGGQNPESTSPTAAFLLAFPLVSSLTGVKVTEVIEEENSDSRHGTPTLLQIGTMDTTKTTQSMHAESLTPNLLNLDNFSFFSGNSFYSSFDNSNNVYPVSSACNSSLQVLENSKAPKEEVLNPTKHSKVVCESQVTQKLQKESVVLRTTATESHPSSVLYTSEAQTSNKPNMVTQQNFVRQNTSVSYSKLATVSSSYVQGTSMTNAHGHYDGRQKISCTTTASSSCKDMNVISYSTPSSRKSSDLGQYNAVTSNAASVAQCNAYNPFSDFSKASTVHSYSTFTKPYSDPLYTNSTHYNYPQHNGNNFEQSVYYSPKSSKTSNVAYSTLSYTDASYSMDCKGKREATNHRHNSINYYNQSKTQTKEKFSSHSSKNTKSTTNQPKAPINWMTTPDFRPQSSNTTEYLVPPPFAKDIDYNPNSFYPSNSFAATTHTSYFNATSTMYAAPEFQNSVADNRKSFDSGLPIISSTNSAQRSEFEENQFSWSPTKLPQFLETPHSFVSSTLPTLVGDLALGTTQAQQVDQGTPREHSIVKSKDSNRRSKVHPVNYDNQSNFLSVSQLVESKTDLGGSNRATNRRNCGGNRNVKNSTQKGNKHAHKATENKEVAEVSRQNFNPKLDGGVEKNNGVKQNVNYNMQVGEGSNWLAECNKSNNRHGHKNPQSSYSAEALIGHQDQSDSSIPKQRYRQQQTNYAAVNKTIPIPSFLSDNIVPYFPPVEIPQDNNFIQTNSNYQSTSLAHNFPTSVQNNAYSSGTYISTGATITSSYLQTSGLIPEFGTHDYSAAISDTTISHAAVASDKVVENKHCNNRNEGVKQAATNNRTEERPNLSQQINTDCSANTSNNFMKKSKHKHPNDGNMPGIVDFGFLSMPSTINSPILPDDFHAHSNFLPPPTPSQLYPCKNPLYPKQSSDLNSSSLLPLPPVPVSRSGPQHFEGSATAGNASSSLTSFNLSAIFPEINKGAVPLPGLYSESSRNKNYNFQRNYLGGSVQVSCSNKSTAASSYVNSVVTTYAPSN